jgi:hypothetical protein
MFKRANKITALLVAAASVMSVVPAMAAEKIDSREGTVKQGFAFEDGKYGYYGYRTDSDETGIWFNKGGDDKDSAIEDLDEYEYNNTSKYGEKYAYALNDSNNDDEYIIDLSTGKVVEDETVEEKQDSAQSKLESALKKADRYDGLRDSSDKISLDGEFNRVLTGQLGEVWYKATTETAIKYDNDLSFTTTAAVVLTNDAGKYIDVSIDANMRVYSTKKQRAVVIDKFDKLYSDAALTVRLNKVQVLAQTKDSFYVLTEVNVYDSYLYPTTAEANPSTQYFIQKISKARDGQDDGAYLPKSVDSYQLDSNATNKGIYDNGDAHDAYKVIMTTDDGYAPENNLYSVKGDTLYVTRVKDGKAKVFEVKLGKVKSDTLAITTTQNKVIEDVDTNLAKKVSDEDHDIVKVSEDADFTTKKDGIFDNEITGGSQKLNSAVSIDTEGTIWILDTGKVFKYDGDFKQVYSVDRNTDALDVYNDGNLIAYEIDGGAYTTVQEGKKQTVDNAVEVDPNLGKTTPAQVGWKQEATGWTFYDVNGTKVANYWVNDNGTWYYIKADGTMATGWAQVNGTWYYLKANGAMATGWLNDNGTWYYLASSGAMLANTTVDGYKLGASGAWIQ